MEAVDVDQSTRVMGRNNVNEETEERRGKDDESDVNHDHVQELSDGDHNTDDDEQGQAQSPIRQATRPRQSVCVRSQHGIDFDEVFALVARIETIRYNIGLATLNAWEVHHLDVKTTFLHGELKEEVYFPQPEGFEMKRSEDKVYKLNKALYGLKQAPKAWNKELNKTLKEWGFDKCSKEPALYRKEENLIVVTVYIDDLMVTGSSLKMIADFKEEMATKLELSDLGKLTYYLGIEVCQHKDGMIEFEVEHILQVINQEPWGWSWNKVERESLYESGGGIIGLREFGSKGIVRIETEENIRVMNENIENEAVKEVEEKNEGAGHESDEEDSDEEPQPQLRRSTRAIVKPACLNDYILLAETECERLLMTINEESWNFHEAREFKVWGEACKEELCSIEKNKTWNLVDLIVGVKPTGLKWVFKIKRNADGSINKHKARLVVKSEEKVYKFEEMRSLIVIQDACVGVMSRYIQEPKKPHGTALKQTLRYLRGTLAHGLSFKRVNKTGLVGYSNSSHNVALFSCEAEFMATTEAAVQAIWLQDLLGEVIEFLKECVENGQVEFEHVLGGEQKVDTLTKVLGRVKFQEMRELIGVREVTRNDFKLKGENVGVSLKKA